jgi:nitrite reductase (NO-forming)
VIGAIFDRVWFEGNPKNEMRGMQAALIGSSNGAVLEFIVPEEGGYVLVDHELADASKGAIGQIVGEGWHDDVDHASDAALRKS